MYLAALWAGDRATIVLFLDGLRSRQTADGFDRFPSYVFESIGEVSFLRRRMNEMVSTTASPVSSFSL
jgi:hypothetical protein